MKIFCYYGVKDFYSFLSLRTKLIKQNFTQESYLIQYTQEASSRG